MVLLEEIPSFTWWGGFGISAIFGIIAFLFNSALNSEKDKRKKMESDIEELQKADRHTNDKINEVNLKILSDINAIGIKLAEFKRDLTK